jgi:diguanylate cyclase (GGDEF)-like protein
MSPDESVSRLRVLVVDDDIVDRMTIARLLVRSFELTLCASAEDALNSLAAESFHCVLIDYRLPDSDGLSLLEALRNDPNAPAAIILTGSGDESVAVNAMKRGAHDYLTKASLERDALIGAIFEAHERRQAEREEEHLHIRLAQRANFDQLSGLRSRSCFDEHLERELKRSRRYGSALAIALVDIDFFKQLNDALGHLGGDEVLRAVAEVIRGTLRDVDLAARWGGDEFALLLPKTDADAAAHAGKRICDGARKLCFATKDGRVLVPTCSIGIAAWGGGSIAPGDLLRAADSALYEAKAAGRDRCVLSRTAPSA